MSGSTLRSTSLLVTPSLIRIKRTFGPTYGFRLGRATAFGSAPVRTRTMSKRLRISESPFRSFKDLSEKLLSDNPSCLYQDIASAMSILRHSSRLQALLPPTSEPKGIRKRTAAARLNTCPDTDLPFDLLCVSVSLCLRGESIPDSKFYSFDCAAHGIPRSNLMKRSRSR